MSSSARLDHVDYDALDRAKNAFIAASRRTLDFAKDYGFIPDERLGASANVFALNLKPFFKSAAEELAVTLIPEGLGTADDARPDDLTPEEARIFWHNIAYKLLSAITNDAATGGLQPILLSLYLPSSAPELVFTEEFLDGFLDGMVDGCRDVGCVYFSGETPQLKNKLVDGFLDIAGATFALQPANTPPVNRDAFGSGNKIVLLASSGVHENGFTSFRQLADELPDGYRTKLPSGEEYWSALNAPSVLYTPLVQDALRQGVSVTNLESVSGHGWQKLMRSGEPLRYLVAEALPVPEIFRFIQEQTGVSNEDMLNKFNYGAGYAVFTETDDGARQVVEIAQKHGINAIVAGQVEPAEAREVVVEPFEVTLRGEEFLLSK